MSQNAPVHSEKTIFGHPAGLFVLFFTEMWERFSYYGMRAILVIYIIAGADANQINLTGAEANGAGEVGCYVRCVAVKFDGSGHSQWQVTGLLGTDDPNGNMSTIFVDRD